MQGFDTDIDSCSPVVVDYPQQPGRIGRLLIAPNSLAQVVLSGSLMQLWWALYTQLDRVHARLNRQLCFDPFGAVLRRFQPVQREAVRALQQLCVSTGDDHRRAAQRAKRSDLGRYIRRSVFFMLI